MSAQTWRLCRAATNNQNERCKNVFKEHQEVCSEHSQSESVFPEQIMPLLRYKGEFSVVQPDGSEGVFSSEFKSPMEITSERDIMLLGFKAALETGMDVRSTFELVSWTLQK